MSKATGVPVKLVQIWSALMQISGGFTCSIVAGSWKKIFRSKIITPGNPWVGEDFNKAKISPMKSHDFCNEPRFLFLFWSYLLIPLYVILIALNIIKSVELLQVGFRTIGSTFRIPTAISSLYGPITFIILFLLLIFSSEKLSCLLSQLNLVTPQSVTPSKWRSYKLFFVGLVTSCGCGIYVTVSLFGDGYSSKMRIEFFTKFCAALIELVTIFLTFNISFGYYAVGCHLSVLISDLRKKIEAQACLGCIDVEKPFVLADGKRENENPWRMIEDNNERDTQMKKEADMPIILPDGKQETENHLLRIRNDLAEIIINLQDLHTCQELTNEYFSPPLLVIFTQTMIYITLAIFNTTVEGVARSLQDFAFWFSFNTSLLLFLCCTPDFVSSQLGELRFTANQWRMKVSDANLETKLTYLLDLVDNYPPFSVGRFFVAAKARLIDIASFIATYLIILLQFRANENGKKENNSTCSVAYENVSSMGNMS